MPFNTLIFLALAGLSSAGTDPRLQIALATTTKITGDISYTPGGRLFAQWNNYLNGTTGPPFAEVLADNSSVAYPDAEWNSWNSSDPSMDPATHFISVAANRLGPDGNLYVLDNGYTDTYGPKLVSFNLTTNELVGTWSLANMTISGSQWDDFRFNGDMVYFTDLSAAIGLLDMTTGTTRRVLENDISTTSYFPMSAAGKLMSLGGSYPFTNSDQLEVAADGTYLYYQPCNGGMWRIATTLLDAALTNDTAADALSASAEPYAPTPSTGGTAIDADGTVYASDADRNAIVRVFSNGTMDTLVQDDRLLWVDCMWVDAQNRLWMPATQLFLGSNWNGGVDGYEPPFYVFTMDIGVGPSPLDHA